MTFLVATGAAVLNVGGGSLGFPLPLALAARGAPLDLDGEPSGAKDVVLVASFFLAAL